MGSGFAVRLVGLLRGDLDVLLLWEEHGRQVTAVDAAGVEAESAFVHLGWVGRWVGITVRDIERCMILKVRIRDKTTSKRVQKTATKGSQRGSEKGSKAPTRTWNPLAAS